MIFVSVVFFNMFVFFSHTIKRHKSRLNRRLNPGLKSLFFLMFFQCSADFPSSSFKISILQQSFLFFYMLICFLFVYVFVSLLLSICFPVVSMLFLFFWIVFYVQSFCGIVVFKVYFFVFYLVPWFWSSVRIFFTTLCGVHWHIVSGFR